MARKLGDGRVQHNEIKSGSGPLSEGHDKKQIDDLLAATAQDGGATVTKAGESYKSEQVMLTIIDLEKAKHPESVEMLKKWLDEKHFTLEVFDSQGRSVEITGQSVKDAMGKADLAGYLATL